MKNKSQKKMLSSKGQRIGTCGTPNRFSSQLYDKFTFIICFLFVK